MSSRPDVLRSVLDGGGDYSLDSLDARFVSPIERPLFDALGAHQPRALQNLQMFACGGLADPHLPGNKHAAHPVLDQIAVNLGREVPPRIL